MVKELARPSVVPLPSKEDLGPAMQELTDNQIRFVIAMTDLAATNPTEAARVAGYGGTEASTRTAAKVLVANPKVIAALREAADQMIRSSVLIASRALIEIATTRGHKDQMKAADILMNRADLVVKTQHEITVKDERTPQEVIDSIREIANKLGQDPRKLLPGTVIDVPYTDVTPSAAPPGLEDMF